MKQQAFAELKQALDDACLYLRAFTLGRYRVTQRHGVVGMQQVRKLCDRMTQLFATGPDAIQSARLVTSAGFRLRAAEARLALLRKSK